MRVFKRPNFKARGELVLGFWWHINPHIPYKKLMLQGYFLARDHIYICDKLHMVLWKRMKSICVATFPDLYVMRRLSRFLDQVFPRSRLNARTYSRVPSPSTSGPACHTHPTMHFPTSSACTSYMAIPISTWIRNSVPEILAVTVPS